MQPELQNDPADVELLQRRLDRERSARLQAETALEHKSLELYEAGQRLRVANQQLEGQVREQATARRESEARAALILDNALEAVVVMDGAGQIIGWNMQAERTFGWTASEAHARTFADLLAPCDRQRVDPRRIVSDAEMGAAPVVERIEVAALHRSTRTFPAELAVAMLPCQAGITFSAFFRDITRAREADRRRSTLYQVTRVLADSTAVESAVPEILQSICQGIGWDLGIAWRVDPGRQTLAFQTHWGALASAESFVAASREFVFVPGTGLPGRVWATGAPAWLHELPTDENFPRAAAASEAGLRTGVAFPVKVGQMVIGVLEFFGVEPRDIDAELLPMLQAMGSQIGQFVQRRRAEHKARLATEAAERARAEAEAASAAKSEFLANMSHELRTPLNGVVGMVDLLLGSDPTAKQRRYCEVARASARSLLELINDILDLSKIEAGKLELELGEFDLIDLISSVGMMLAPRADARELKLTCSIDPSVPAWAEGDPLRLRQVLINLVSNAIKFTEAGSVAIDAAVESSADDCAVVRFQVRDTGPGIPPDRLGRLFKSFSQVDASTSRRHGGTGLGLAICKRLAELMGGAIGVESVEGQGSNFWFTARLKRCPARALAPADQTPARRLKGARILVAEDNEFNQLVVSELLGQFGCSVTIANNGREAVAAAEAGEYDVILMDCQMPEVDGFEAARRIRALESGRSRRRPIIALTANAIKGDRERCLAAGMDGYVTKPIELEKLIGAIALLLPASDRTDDLPAPSPASANVSPAPVAPPANADAPPADSPATQSSLSSASAQRSDSIPATGDALARSRSAISAAPEAPSPAESSDSASAEPPPIDMPSLLNRCGDSQELVLTLLGKFDAQARAVLDTLRGLVKPDGGSGETAVRAAHTLKGMAANFSADAVSAAAAELEASLRAGDVAAACAILPRLEQRTHECLAYIPAARASLG